MSYRTPLKLNSRNEYKCIKCKYCEIVKQIKNNTFVKCNAKDTCFHTEFSAKYFSCKNNLSIDTNEKIILKSPSRKNKYELTGNDKKYYKQIGLFD